MSLFVVNIGLATKWLRILSISPNGKIRNHLVANPTETLKCFFKDIDIPRKILNFFFF